MHLYINYFLCLLFSTLEAAPMLSVFEERKFDRNNTKNKTLTIYSNLFSLLGRDTHAHEYELQKKPSLIFNFDEKIVISRIVL